MVPEVRLHTRIAVVAHCTCTRAADPDSLRPEKRANNYRMALDYTFADKMVSDHWLLLLEETEKRAAAV